ncbi:sensor histidine kinase [Pseudoalteromonas ardens]|uniref:sensor histidine kinase n=1 Tax=Pseudoalteromonas ardens TaxID=3048490 RepID=UPI0024C3A330|nr:ATP-binding protein [Pseudoalteromonas sp. R96]MDK1313787.1 ATP-binding protein [Pseudoalteromonas sp. R96]
MKANFERALHAHLALLGLVVVALLSYLLWQQALPWWQVVLIAGGVGGVLWRLHTLRLTQLESIFSRAHWQLEAMQQADFSQQIRPHFHSGQVAAFEQQLIALGEQLHHQKSRYNSQIFVIYQLIDKLNTPILVFTEESRLSYANQAFESLYRQPWQHYKGATALSLGLEEAQQGWQFVSHTQGARWQLHSSYFYEQGKRHSLLVALDITKALRQKELAAWQQLIRVISHEIRNSLTPVSSLAQSLAERATSAREQQALSVIEQRCQHLQHFVARYGEISKVIEPQLQQVQLHPLFASVQDLFASQHPTQRIVLDCQAHQCHCDPQLLEQVLINLVKNAIEANQTATPAGHQVLIRSYYLSPAVVIEVADEGGGFANLDNVLTPFYSTKTEGQGIGLTFSQHVIECHEGQFDVANEQRGERVGAVIKMTLPS